MKNTDVSGIDFVKPHRFANRLARAVHECHWLQKQNLVRAQTALGQLTLKLGFPRAKAVVFGNAIKRHEADIVTVSSVLSSRISQTDKQFHRSPPWLRTRNRRKAGYAQPSGAHIPRLVHQTAPD